MFRDEFSYVWQYCHEIEQGNIIVGEELKMMLSRLKLEMFDTDYRNKHDIIVNYTESQKRIKFIETNCKHYESPFAGKPFKLELFQKAFIEAIFAIKIWNEELCRYVRKYIWVLYLVGRKNGKTPLIGAIVLSEWFCGPIGLKALCGSNDYEQAALLFDAINAMREESPKLERVTRKNIKGIFFGNPKQKKKRGKFSAQNKGSIKKISAKSGAKEGRNIAIGAVDEVFEMEDDRLVMPIRQALSTQDEPLYFELTTEGFTNDGYLDKRLAEARKVLNGEGTNPEIDERWLIWLYTQDNEREIWENEKSWYKSNPGLGVIKKWSFLRELVSEARTNKSTRAFVLAKEFNVKQNNAQAWLSEAELEKLDGKTFDTEILREKLAVGGCDLSESGDLTNGRMMFVDPWSGYKYFISMYFLPSIKKDDNPLYEEWAKQGYLYLCEGGEVDYSDVVNWFIGQCKKYNCRIFRVGYDKWQAKGFTNLMDENGFDLERVAQGDALSNAMTLFENDLAEEKIYTNDNPIDRYCFKNVAAEWNSKGTKRQPVKVQGETIKKIDGAVTTLICYETLDRYRSDYMGYQKGRWKNEQDRNGGDKA